MNNQPVCFIDSGIGGLPYACEFKQSHPAENIVYVADKAYFPYGNKPTHALRSIITGLTSAVIRRFAPKMIVLACNTGSVLTLSHLRERFSIPFIGVVPAVKPAAEITTSRRIGVIATSVTVKDSYITKLVQNFADGCKVELIPAPGLAEFVEKHAYFVKEQAVYDHLAPIYEKCLAIEADSIVMGCTHYVHLIPYFKILFGDTIHVIDSVTGVVNQTGRIVRETGLNTGPSGVGAFYHTGSPTDSARYAYIANKFGLTMKGVLSIHERSDQIRN